MISRYLRNQNLRKKILSRNRKAQPSRKIFQPRFKICPVMKSLGPLSIRLRKRRRKKR